MASETESKYVLLILTIIWESIINYILGLLLFFFYLFNNRIQYIEKIISST